MDLNANKFDFSLTRRNTYFESILAKCVIIYNTICRTNTLIANDENTIRNKFLEYLQNINFKMAQELKHLKFDKEIPERTGRVDIRVLPTKDEYINDEAYYIIECKRLDSNNLSGNTGLNAEYVKNGVCRFVTDYYSSYFGCNAMFGFVVESVNIQTDIVDNINSMLTEDFTNAQGVQVNANATQVMQYEKFVCGYPYSYISKHTHISGKEIDLYHLMFDLSSNIQ